MALLIINKNDKEQMRSEMRDSMRRGGMASYRNYGSVRDEVEHSYREGYRHGWEDSENDWADEHYRRARDSRGRFV